MVGDGRGALLEEEDWGAAGAEGLLLPLLLGPVALVLADTLLVLADTSITVLLALRPVPLRSAAD